MRKRRKVNLHPATGAETVLPTPTKKRGKKNVIQKPGRRTQLPTHSSSSSDGHSLPANTNLAASDSGGALLTQLPTLSSSSSDGHSLPATTNLAASDSDGALLTLVRTHSSETSDTAFLSADVSASDMPDSFPLNTPSGSAVSLAIGFRVTVSSSETVPTDSPTSSTSVPTQDQFVNLTVDLQSGDFAGLGARPLPPPKQSYQAQSTESVDQETDDIGQKLAQFDKGKRQRASDLYQKLPKNAYKRANVLAHMVGRGFRSPRTMRIMPEAIRRAKVMLFLKDQVFEHQQTAEGIQKLYRQIIHLRTKKKFSQASEIASKLRADHSIRDIARILHISFSSAWRLISNIPMSEGGQRKIKKEQKLHVQKFFQRTNITMQVPLKRHAGQFFMRKPFREAYEDYKNTCRQSGKRVLSMTSVRNCLPRNFKTMRKVPYKECLCPNCTNSGLARDGLIAAGVQGVDPRTSENVFKSLCPAQKSSEEYPVAYRRRAYSNNPTRRKLKLRENELAAPRSVTHPAKYSQCLTDFKRECIFRECSKCGREKLLGHIYQQNPTFQPERIVNWRQWEYITERYKVKDQKSKETITKEKKRLERVDKKTTLGELLEKHLQHTLKMSSHLFHFRWQAEQFELCKSSLADQVVLVVMDYAMNYTVRAQGEVQPALWHRQQVTLHPVVVYCYDKCGHVVTMELVMASDDRIHDAYASKAFLDQAMAHLEKKKIKVHKLIIFSDNCSAQYKCKRWFAVLSKVAPKEIEHHYFGENHGKGPADGCIGRLKRELDLAVRTDQASKIKGAKSLVEYCTDKLSLTKPQDGMCTHYQRSFFNVEQIDRSQTINMNPIAGIRSYHMIGFTEDRKHTVLRKSSCFCRCWHKLFHFSCL